MEFIVPGTYICVCMYLEAAIGKPCSSVFIPALSIVSVYAFRALEL